MQNHIRLLTLLVYTYQICGPTFIFTLHTICNGCQFCLSGIHVFVGVLIMYGTCTAMDESNGTFCHHILKMPQLPNLLLVVLKSAKCHYVYHAFKQCGTIQFCCKLWLQCFFLQCDCRNISSCTMEKYIAHLGSQLCCAVHTSVEACFT